MKSGLCTAMSDERRFSLLSNKQRKMSFLEQEWKRAKKEGQMFVFLTV